MRLQKMKKVTRWAVMMLLILTFVFALVGCGTKETNKETVPLSTEVAESTEENVVGIEEQNETEITVLGEGETSFPFMVVDENGNETRFEIHTDKKIVGEALMDVDLISGEEGEFGLYVKVVNGITADYDVNQTYWAFYINEEYAVSGVDTTEIEEGSQYSLRIEK